MRSTQRPSARSLEAGTAALLQGLFAASYMPQGVHYAETEGGKLPQEDHFRRHITENAMVYETARAVSIPILGMGGILTPEDAVEFLLAGATAVEVGTASFADPRAVENLARGLESWCRSHHVERVASLTGSLEVPRK